MPTYVKNYDTLATNDNRKIVLDLIETAYASISPVEVFKKDFSLTDKVLKIKDKTFDLNNFERVYLIGFGKGSAGNCKILEEKLGDLLTEGFDIDVVEDPTFAKIKYTKGTHPLPSQENFDFAKDITERFSSLTEKDLVLIVTCGGGSVLFEVPHVFTLDQMIEVNKALLHCGANITEMNAVRKHLSKVKGGGLAKILYPATVANLIFSDVPGNDLSVIASAPLVKDTTTNKIATNIYEKYKLKEYNALTPADFTETPKEEKYFAKVSNILMLSNLTALNAMEKKARSLGYEVYLMTDRLQGDTRTMGEKLINETPNGHILIAGGETTMKVTGTGKGGRNQALSVSALPHIKGDTVLASFGSDGWDFYELAGGIVDHETIKKAKDLNVDAKKLLANDDSYTFLEKVGDGIVTGKQDSNVSDLFIVLRKQ
jgi:glycerate 2-kinase